MNYYINLFSPETARGFSASGRNITGFRIAKRIYIEKKNVSIGDRLICYCTGIQRFIGIFTISSKPFVDDEPLFMEKNDPYVLRFQVEPLVWLPLEHGLPIHAQEIWSKLSFTRNLPLNSNEWTYMLFSSPRRWPKRDSEFIERKLLEQSRDPIEYPFTEADEKKLKPARVRVDDHTETIVTVPEERPLPDPAPGKDIPTPLYESFRMQAKLAEIGETLGYKIWLPRSDRGRVTQYWHPKEGSLLERLPLVFDETTLRTIQNIDTLWIRRRSVVRAFEVEDTTSIYSGILRMADLLSLQPMLDIKIHIVAPGSRREAVFQQIARPVFAFLEKGPLTEFCTYIAYDSIHKLAREKQLKHMTDTILDEYVEYADQG